jgi:hypothetical protein
MLRQLHGAEKEISLIAGRAEALPCRTASFDLVTVAQAGIGSINGRRQPSWRASFDRGAMHASSGTSGIVG